MISIDLKNDLFISSRAFHEGNVVIFLNMASYKSSHVQTVLTNQDFPHHLAYQMRPNDVKTKVFNFIFRHIWILHRNHQQLNSIMGRVKLNILSVDFVEKGCNRRR